MPLSQDHRHLRLDTPLGENVLLIQRLNGNESVSELFEFQVELVSEERDLDPKKLLGQNVTVTLDLEEEGQRFFNAQVRTFSLTGQDDRLAYYEATLVPWLWFLDLAQDCRVFQEQTALEVIESVFGEFSFGDYELQVNRSLASRVYCVQYRETAFAFVSRLLEEEGLFYYFRHEDGKHTLVIADHAGVYEEVEESNPSFRSPDDHAEEVDKISSWERRYAVHTGKRTLVDYDFEKPSASLEASTSTVTPLSLLEAYEVYEHPGGYLEKSQGDALVAIRMEESEVAFDTVLGASLCRSFRPGGRFTLEAHPSQQEAGTSWVLAKVHHVAAVGASFVSGGTANTVDYSNSFSCIPDDKILRPARRTQRGQVQGLQSAVVVGPAGEEIHTDEFGRVRVQFHWDRLGSRNEASSCWLRVSQFWASGGFGAVFLPRIGDEVLVDFLEGDPDRPIVTGRVYNGEKSPPWSLPGEKNRSGIKTRSTPGGGGYNEISFDDSAGAEEIRIHAQKDENTVVENNRTERVGVNEKVTIGANRSHTIGANDKLKVGKDRSSTIGKNDSLHVALMRTTNVGVNDALNVGGAQEINVVGARAINVGGVQAIDVVGLHTVNCGAAHEVNIAGKQSISVGKEHEFSAKEMKVSAEKDYELSAKDVKIKGQTSIKLEVGGSSIEITPSGVTIKGPMINVQATGIVDVKGAMVKLNS